MEEFEDFVRNIFLKHLKELNDALIECLLDDLIEGILDEWQKNPEVNFEFFKANIIRKLRESEKEICQQ